MSTALERQMQPIGIFRPGRHAAVDRRRVAFSVEDLPSAAPGEAAGPAGESPEPAGNLVPEVAGAPGGPRPIEEKLERLAARRNGTEIENWGVPAGITKGRRRAINAEVVALLAAKPDGAMMTEDDRRLLFQGHPAGCAVDHCADERARHGTRAAPAIVSRAPLRCLAGCGVPNPPGCRKARLGRLKMKEPRCARHSGFLFPHCQYWASGRVP
jgi:hypothetical protein